MNKTFDEAKEETYSRFAKRCRRLLQDYLKEKNAAVCAKCSESCSDGEKVHKAVRNLSGELTLEAAKRCDDKIDFLVCLLCPYLASSDLVRSVAKGKKMKALAREMEKSGDRLLAVIRRGEKHELQGH